MLDPLIIPRVYLRSDSMTGAENMLAFFEWLWRYTKDHPVNPFSLISLDVIELKELNDKYGFAAGDAALRWITLVLQEEGDAIVYRISGDEFVGVLVDGNREDHIKRCEKVKKRLEDEAGQVNLADQPARVVLIHFPSLESSSPEDVLGLVYGALLKSKLDPENKIKIYDQETHISGEIKNELINDMIRRLVSLGSMLDRSQRLANTDSISGLPNMLAAEDKFQSLIDQHQTGGKMFSVLLIDGDNLRIYNKISYLAGDKMIARLGQVLSDELRPTDFLARWRTGDEFLILFEDTPLEQAVKLGNRLREAVGEKSREWDYPVTISIGAASLPRHGTGMDELVDFAERGLAQAKAQGKNQVCVFKDEI